MDPAEFVQFGKKTTSCEMKTDLELLLECLKFQMDNPDSQKDTLVAVRSICQNNSDASDYFRKIGGLIFIDNLAKSRSHGILKEASLYTLGILAESNVYCQQTLCTLDLFEDVLKVLSDEQSSVTLKRMSVFILLVLVSNNKTGQTLARESGCIEMLLLLFSEMLACNIALSIETTNQQYQLWSSVCSALCSCVNNPQNEDNQRLCSSAFPQASEWLQNYVQPEITRPICSLICLTVANNSFAQDYFASVGGLDTLAEVLLQLVKGLQTNPSNLKLAVVVTKTLDACISENLKTVHHLSRHSIISSLISLLSCGELETEDMFSIVLTLGHCTEECEPNQCELLKCNGLPLMIQMLSESKDDELHKAATFVLQNCRHITERLSVNIHKNTPSVEQCSTSNHNKRHKCLTEYWEKAKVIARKIENLQQECDKNNEEPIRTVTPADKDIAQFPYFTKNIAVGHLAVSKEPLTRAHDNTAEKSQMSTQCLHQASAHNEDVMERRIDLPCRDQNFMPDSSRNDLSARKAVIQTTPNHVTKHLRDGIPQSEETQSAHGCSVRQIREINGKCSTSKENNIDPLLLCAEIIDKEISSTLNSQQVPLTEWRCSGCISSAMNSRNCNKILRECSHLCDHHRLLLKAEDQYKSEIRKSLHGTGRFTGCNNKRLTPVRTSKKINQSINRILMTPIKRLKNEGPDLEHNKELPGQRQEIFSDECHSLAYQNPWTRDKSKVQRRRRKDFTQNEIANLLDGVKKFGRHWNAILWSYPFQKGRTNVDLAKKYKKLVS